MIRLHVTAEGQTEQNFVKEVLAPHLATKDIFIDARCVLTSKDKRAGKIYRGGMTCYQKAKADILTWIKQDDKTDCRFTTMFDLYALPEDFPGYSASIMLVDPYKRVAALEAALQADINDYRFVPYIQLHEFEALILAEPSALDWEYLEHEAAIASLVSMVGAQNPELINCGRETAPSKRILSKIKEYDKVTSGVSVAKKIGLATLKLRCRHFDQWLTCMENLK